MFLRLTVGILMGVSCTSNLVAQDRAAHKPFNLRALLNPSALIEWESAYAFGDREIQKTEFIFKPEFNIDLSKNVRWVIRSRIYTEVTDRLEPGKPNQVEVSDLSRRWIMGDRLEAELREFYFDIKIKKTFLTIGKQQIVWGKADGLRIMDLVNPFNFREFLLDEFEDSRIPLWSLKADIPIKGISAQFVWIPDQSYNDLPDPAGTYAFGQAFEGISNIRQKPLHKPDRFIQDSDVGLRLSTFFKGWDLTLNYLYFYDDFSVNFQSTPLIDNVPILTISPRYLRNHLLGATFSNAFGSFTLRGEAGYQFDKYVATNDTTHPHGVMESGQLMAVSGLDYSGITNTTLSAQLFVDWITNDTSILGRDHFETNVSLLFSRNFINETLDIDLIGIRNINRGEGFVQGKVNYLLKSNLSIWLGGEIIYGDRDTFIGQFKGQDRIYLGMELGI